LRRHLVIRGAAARNLRKINIALKRISAIEPANESDITIRAGLLALFEVRRTQSRARRS